MILRLFLVLSFLTLLSWPIKKHQKYAGFDMPKNTFALTFDDGPYPERTLKILNDLDRYGVKATFFVVSGMAKGREWLIQEEIARGHTIGCHTVTHPMMTKLSKANWKNEIDQCVRDVEKITKVKVTLFRFPYGESTYEMEEYANSKGLKTVLWNIDSLDWKKTSKEELDHTEKQIDEIKRGIILMHDIQASTVESLPNLLEFLKQRKATLVNLVNI